VNSDARSTDVPFDGEQPSNPVEQRIHRRLKSYLRRSILQPERRLAVLVIGCRNGDDVIWLSDLGHRVVATDPCPDTLAKTMQRARRAGLDDRIQTASFNIETCTADQLPSEVDLVLCNAPVVNSVDATSIRRLGVAASAWIRPHGRLLIVNIARAACEHSSGTGGIRPHSERILAENLSPAFSLVRPLALTVLLPPATSSTRDRTKTPAFLGRVDALLASLPGTHHIARTVLLDFEKTDASSIRAGWKRQVWQGEAAAPAASFQGSSGFSGHTAIKAQSTRSAIDR
jgi:hypothetical protein